MAILLAYVFVSKRRREVSHYVLSVNNYATGYNRGQILDAFDMKLRLSSRPEHECYRIAGLPPRQYFMRVLYTV